MAIGESGPHGQHVEVTARSQDPEVVTILLQQMEEIVVLAILKSQSSVLEVNVL